MKRELSKSGQLGLFFALAFLIAWATWIPAFLNPTFPSQVALIGLFGPALAAVIVAWLAEGRAGVKAIFSRALLWRFPVGWWALALLLMPALFTAAALADLAARGGDPSTVWLGPSPLFVAAAFAFLLVINSGEEIGWRGYALPLLNDLLHSDFKAGVLLGIIWGVWHLPTYLVAGQSNFPLAIFLAFILGLSLIYSALFRGSGGSLLAADLFHASTDIVPRVMAMASFGVTVFALATALVWIAAGLLWLRSRLLWDKKKGSDQLSSPSAVTLPEERG